MNTLIIVSTDCGLHLVRMNLTATDQTERNGQIIERAQAFFDKSSQTVTGYAEFANLNTIVI